MIIKEITIYGYGKWVDQHFSFTSPVQVIYGPNEAGKSTMIDFIISLLFGFQNKRQAVHGQYLPKNSSAYGGEMVFVSQDTTYRLTRIAGTHGGKVTLYDETNQLELADTDLQKILGPVDRSVYTSFFYFGELDQQAFYKMSLSDLQLRIQQIGISNANDWFDLQTDLQKKADNLYTPRGRKPVINQQLKEYSQLTTKVAAARDKYPQYDQQTSQLADLQMQRKETDQKISELQTQVQHYQHLAQVSPLIKQKHRLAQEVDQLAPQFIPTEQITEIQRLIAEKKNLDSQLTEMMAVKTETTNNQDLLSFLKQNAELIGELKSQLAINMDRSSQISFLEKEIEAKQQKVTQQIANLGSSITELPIPFETNRLGEISAIINDDDQNTRSKGQSQSVSSAPVMVLGAGVISFVIGMAAHLNWLMILAVIIFGGAGFTWWRQKSISMPNDVSDDQHQMQVEQIRRDYRLNDIPVDRWLAIQSDLQSIYRQKDEIKQQTEQVDQLSNQLTNYLEQWQFASHWLPSETGGQRDRLEVIQLTLTDWQATQHSADQEQRYAANHQQQVQQKQLQLEQVQVELQKDYQKLGLDNEQQLANRIEINQEYQDKQQQLEVIESQLKDLPTVTDTEVADVDAKLNNLTSELTTNQQLNNEQSKQIAETQATIQHLVNDGSYYELRQQQANLQTEINDNVIQWLGYRSALTWLETTMNIITKGRVPKVLELTTKYFAILTNQSYNKVIFQDAIRIVREDDTVFEINELSRGTLEQLYFALVLALAVGFHEDFALPIIIDDGFVNFDGQRKQAAKKLLTEIGKQNQVLFYTADNNQLSEFNEDQIITLG